MKYSHLLFLERGVKMTKKIVQCKLFLDIFSEAIKKLNKTLNKHDHKIIDCILFKGSDYGKPASADVVYHNIFNILPSGMERPTNPKQWSKYFSYIHGVRTKLNEEKFLSPGEKEEKELFYFINQYYLNIIDPFMRKFLKKRYARKFYKKYIHEAISTNNKFREDVDTFSLTLVFKRKKFDEMNKLKTLTIFNRW